MSKRSRNAWIQLAVLVLLGGAVILGAGLWYAYRPSAA